MAQAEFELIFSGPSLTGGTMDVNELAPALLAIGDLAKSVNSILNGDRASTSVRVKADFKGGSFDVALVLDQGILNKPSNFFPTPRLWMREH